MRKFLWHNPAMKLAIDPRAVAIQPRREAGVRRYTTVLDGADELLREVGLNGFSIPSLAERLGYTRRSIYKFFPTPYAILNELTHRYLDALDDTLRAAGPALNVLPWEEMVREMVRLAAEFHNQHPVGRMLILGGAVTDESYRVTEFAIRKLGKLTTDLLALREIHLPDDPDVASLAVDIGTAVFRVSNLYHGKVTEKYRDEAGHAMVAYLSNYTARAVRRKHTEDSATPA